MTVTILVEGLAEYLANKVFNRVEANMEKYSEEDLEPLEWQQMVERELQEDVPFQITNEMYEMTVESLMSSMPIRSCFVAVETMLREYWKDQEEWAKGESHYYGIQNRDFI